MQLADKEIRGDRCAIQLHQAARGQVKGLLRELHDVGEEAPGHRPENQREAEDVRRPSHPECQSKYGFVQLREGQGY